LENQNSSKSPKVETEFYKMKWCAENKNVECS